MKPKLTILALLFILAACSNSVKGPNGVVYKSAVQYNDYIVARQSTLFKNVMELVKIAETDLDSAANMLDQYVNQADVILKEIKGMPPYKGDSVLRNAAIRSFSFYRQVFDKDYRDIIRIRQSSADSSLTDPATEISQIVDNIKSREEGYDRDFQNAQKDFARKNNMKLVENELQKKANSADQ